MPTDDLNRDKIYSSDPEDDDFEYEVEPPDPAVLDAEKRRAAEVIESTKKSIDIDEVYRDLDARRDSEILEKWAERARGYRYQFQIKHLLILTAVIAVLLTLHRLGVNLITFFVIGAMLAVGGLTLYLQWHERKRQQEADRRRERMYAERRAALEGKPTRTGSPGGKTPPSAPLPPDELETARGDVETRAPYRFQFSLSQFLIAVTCAALLFGFIQLLGGPSNAATLCGFFALGGLVVHALGYEPPEVVAFVWWIMLLMYVGLSVFAAIWSGVGG
jgi:hypothetical protein